MDTQEDSTHYLRQKRDEYLIEIRKKKNVEEIKTKRMRYTLDQDGPQEVNNFTNEGNSKPSVAELASCFINFFKAGNLTGLTAIAKALRLLVSQDDGIPVEELVDLGVIPFVLEALTPKFYGETALLVESSWIITNISSTDSKNVSYLVSLDVIPISMELLDYPDQDVKDNAIWTLSNIAADSRVYRKELIKKGISTKIDNLFAENNLRISVQHSLIWLISNLCRGKPYPDFGEVATFLLYIETFIKNSTDENVLVNCMYTLSYLTDTDDEHQIDSIIDMDIMDDMLRLLKHENPKIIVPLLRTIGNITSNSDEQTQVLINHGFIEAIYPLLDHEKKLIRKEVCWVYSNFLCGVTSQIKKIFGFQQGEILRKLFHLAVNDHTEVSDECIYALSNTCEAGTIGEIGFLVELGMINLIVELLQREKREDIIKICLTALGHILHEGQTISEGPSPHHNRFYEIFSQLNGIVVLERLLEFPERDVFEKVEEILNKYIDKK